MKRLASWIAAWTLSLAAGLALAAQTPQALVHDTSERMLAKLKEERAVLRTHPERVYGLVDQIVLPHFDFDSMSRWVLGKYWRQATPEQQQRFVGEFRTLLVRTYATALAEYKDQKINYLPVRDGGKGDDVTVKTEIDSPGGLPIPLDYSLHRVGDAWKVYDVAVDGLSLVGNYRTSFASEIRASGLDSLIGKLAERNRQSNGE